MTPLAISNGTILILIVVVAVPFAAFSFLGAGKAFDQIGKGGLSLEPIDDSAEGSPLAPPTGAAARDAELRQMIEAKSYRRQMRGEEPLDVEAELSKAIAQQQELVAPPRQGGGELARDTALVAEIRELVIARNARRERQGKPPLDVEAEVQRQIDELENLGQ